MTDGPVLAINAYLLGMCGIDFLISVPFPFRFWQKSDLVQNKKYVLSNLESVQCNFFIFDHVTFIPFNICYCVQNFIKIGWFSLRYGDMSIFKKAAVRHLGIVLPPYETTHEVCCWPQLPVKFHVSRIHRSESIAIWIFRIFGLKCLFRPPKWGSWGTLDP